jgi:hypothetical protein
MQLKTNGEKQFKCFKSLSIAVDIKTTPTTETLALKYFLFLSA